MLIDEPKTEVNETEQDIPVSSEETVEATPAYEPNLSLSIGDETIAFDDRFKSIITDQESEDLIKGLYTDSHSYKKVTSELQRLGELKESSPSEFIKTFGISDDTILELAREILNQEEMSDEDKQKLADEQKSSELNQREQEVALKQHEYELNQALSAPNVIKFAEKFDAKSGKEGAFKSQISTYGASIFNSENRYVSPEQAVQAVMEQFVNFVDLEEPAAPEPLPNLGTTSNSPASKKIKSIDDLKKHIAQMGVK